MTLKRMDIISVKPSKLMKIPMPKPAGPSTSFALTARLNSKINPDRIKAERVNWARNTAKRPHLRAAWKAMRCTNHIRTEMVVLVNNTMNNKSSNLYAEASAGLQFYTNDKLFSLSSIFLDKSLTTFYPAQ